MKTARRRRRRFDPIATPTGVRAICDQLRERCPELIPKSDKQFLAMLNAVRHVERYPATDTRGGRPSRWRRQDLLDVGRYLRAILERETSGRVSLSSFVGLYLRMLHFPADLQAVLEHGDLNFQEAMLLARLTPTRLALSAAKPKPYGARFWPLICRRKDRRTVCERAYGSCLVRPTWCRAKRSPQPCKSLTNC